jgi:hypothetical protein
MREQRPDVIFILSVDTEEEWDWSGEFPQKDFSVSNVKQIPKFQAFCENLGIRPTYFTDYAVAENPEAIAILKAIVDKNTGEIGAHLHPWCNPPFHGKTEEKESHVVNLPIMQVEEKLDTLIALLNTNFGVMPNAFRSGRWGINDEVLTLLEKKGLQVDSSMYPFFKNEYFDCEQTSLIPYWPDYGKPMVKGSQRNIIEIPVTVGFNRKHFPTMLKIYNAISHPLLRHLRLTGIFWHTRLLRKLYLSPEVTSGKDMKPLIDFALNNHHPVIHMYFHSSSLIDGTTGFMQGENTYDIICSNIKKVIDYTEQKANIKFCTISEAASILKQRENYSKY